MFCILLFIHPLVYLETKLTFVFSYLIASFMYFNFQSSQTEDGISCISVLLQIICLANIYISCIPMCVCVFLF